MSVGRRPTSNSRAAQIDGVAAGPRHLCPAQLPERVLREISSTDRIARRRPKRIGSARRRITVVAADGHHLSRPDPRYSDRASRVDVAIYRRWRGLVPDRAGDREKRLAGKDPSHLALTGSLIVRLNEWFAFDDAFSKALGERYIFEHDGWGEILRDVRAAS